MTKPKTFQMMDCSTGHLSPSTRLWLDDDAVRAKHGFMSRDTGYAISSHLGRDDVWPDHKDVPNDLIHVLRYANANDMEWVLFDVDADKDPNLPWYWENGGPIDVQIPEGLTQEHFSFSREPLLKAVDPEKISLGDLKLSGDRILEDEHYTIPENEGAWLGVAGTAVRIRDQEGWLLVTVFVDGHEMDQELSRVVLTADEIEDAKQDILEQSEDPGM
jgi:hypothetical protein